jgi:hypothetical protein
MLNIMFPLVALWSKNSRLGHSKLWEMFLKPWEGLTLPKCMSWKKERFLSISIKRLNGVDGMSFYKRALRISVRQTNLIPCNHITLEWDGVSL